MASRLPFFGGGGKTSSCYFYYALAGCRPGRRSARDHVVVDSFAGGWFPDVHTHSRVRVSFHTNGDKQKRIGQEEERIEERRGRGEAGESDRGISANAGMNKRVKG